MGDGTIGLIAYLVLSKSTFKLVRIQFVAQKILDKQIFFAYLCIKLKIMYNLKVEVSFLFDSKIFNCQFEGKTEQEAIEAAKDFYASEMGTFTDEVTILECKPAFSFKEVSTELFWTMVDGGWTPPTHCFLIMQDGSQQWGYPMSGRFFDHHRQGLSHNQKNIRGVLVMV